MSPSRTLGVAALRGERAATRLGRRAAARFLVAFFATFLATFLAFFFRIGFRLAMGSSLSDYCHLGLRGHATARSADRIPSDRALERLKLRPQVEKASGPKALG